MSLQISKRLRRQEATYLNVAIYAHVEATCGYIAPLYVWNFRAKLREPLEISTPEKTSTGYNIYNSRSYSFWSEP